MKTRSGFSLIEMMLVMVLIGIVAMITVPRLGRGYDKTQVGSARARVGALVNRARGLAMARGCTDTLHVSSGSNGKAWITACKINGTGLDTVGLSDSIATRYGVTLGPTTRNFLFDARGVNPSAASLSVTITKNSTVDSVVVDAMGQVVH